MKNTAISFSRRESGFLTFALGFASACREQELRPDYIALANVVSETPAEGRIELTAEQLNTIEAALVVTLAQIPPGGESHQIMEDLQTHIQTEPAMQMTTKSGPSSRSG
jgi:hypothetical protein